VNEGSEGRKCRKEVQEESEGRKEVEEGRKCGKEGSERRK
jgi:hypothetical protein